MQYRLQSIQIPNIIYAVSITAYFNSLEVVGVVLHFLTVFRLMQFKPNSLLVDFTNEFGIFRDDQSRISKIKLIIR